MANFSGYGTDTNTNNTTICQLIGSASVRAKIYDLVLGSRAAVNDYACGYSLRRTTTAGTGGTAWTPVPLDPLSSAVVSTFRYADTGEPTYTGSSTLLEFDVNQRATFRWVAAPGSELVTVATASNGIGLLAVSPTNAFAVEVTILWSE